MSKVKYYYSYTKKSKRFKSKGVCHRDPLDSTNWLFPANSTETPIPDDYNGLTNEAYFFNEDKSLWEKRSYTPREITVHNFNREYTKYQIIPKINEKAIGKDHLNAGSLITRKLLVDKKFNQIRLDDFNIQMMIANLNKNLLVLNQIIKETYNLINQSVSTISNATSFSIDIKKQNIIHLIKRILDDLIMINSIRSQGDMVDEIKISSIGDLLSPKERTITKEIKEAIKFDIFEDFLKIINHFHNSFKHSVFGNDTINPLTTNIESLYVKNNKLSNMHYLKSNLSDIIFGFDDFIKVYIDLKEPNSVKHKLSTDKKVIN
ncbi:MULTISPECIES: hypothetical protein [Francisella]|uniref:hypothetical protein n=1 Tax=Francisella TaxID=262 RepID=UPI0011B621D3|nr:MULTISPECIES: hypothetical protein [Francisella]